MSEIDSVTDSVIGIYLQTIPVEIGGFHHPFFICKITGDIERRVLASALKRKIVILDRSGTQQLFLPVCLLCRSEERRVGKEWRAWSGASGCAKIDLEEGEW